MSRAASAGIRSLKYLPTQMHLAMHNIDLCSIIYLIIYRGDYYMMDAELPESATIARSALA